MLLRHSFFVIYVTSFIPIIGFQAYNWYLSSLQSFQHIHRSGFDYLSTYAHSPCYNPHSTTYLAPSSCDRNRPPRSQVVCKLLPFAPIVPLCPPLQNPNPFSDFPEPNVNLIKAHLNPLPSIPNSNYS
jgi:hypothetical protein